MSATNAYQKMLKNGSAFKEVDTSMYREPSLYEAEGVGGLGNKIEEEKIEEKEDHTDYSEFDNHMEERMQSLRSKMNGGKGKPVKESNDVVKLKKRVKKLEEAMVLLMKTHEKLLS